MLQIDPECVEKIEIFIVFGAISFEFPRFFVQHNKNSNIINTERKSYALHFLNRMFQRFAS